MKYLTLVWASLWRRKARTILTLLSVLVAFLLFGLLDTVRTTFVNAGQTAAGRDRLVVLSRTGLGKALPYSLLARLEGVPGVAGVDYASYVAGTYQDPKNTIVVEAHADSFYDIYPEVEVAPEALAALRRTRTGVLVGEGYANKYGWKPGDKIPLQTQQARKDGSTVWTFDAVGILRFSDPNMKVYEEMLFGNWAYVEESRQKDSGTVAWYSVKVANVADVDRVARQIDALTANSAHETKTQTENAFASGLFQQFGDIGLVVTSIMGAVFFTLVLLTGHTMANAVQERIPELAVLKTLGFSGSSILGLVLSEAVVLLLCGAVVGLGVAVIAILVMRAANVSPIPILPIGPEVWMRGLLLATLVGLLIGAFPAVQAMRLPIVDGLRGLEK
jgi:putative ABC transport system permease protein